MRDRLVALAVALVCGMLAIFLAFNGRDAVSVRKANELGAAGQYAAAVAEAEKVHSAPAEGGALLAKARALTAAGHLHPADAAWAAVARRDPNNWQAHFQWAQAVSVLGGSRAAVRAHYARARELNPRLPAL
jgi:tetratricopeptide (TPR) repeat protein